MGLIDDLIKENLAKAAKLKYLKINGSEENPQYLHDSMLDAEYSSDMTYDSISGDFARVTADVVSFDSPLPIKKRASLSSSKGMIPKVGMKFTMNEKQLNTLRILSLDPSTKGQLVKEIFKDPENAIFGVKELHEKMLLNSLSGAAMLVPDEENVGTAVRITYDVPDENKYGATVKWSNLGATPITDMKRIIRAARKTGGVNEVFMDSYTVDALLANKQVKDQFAFSQNFVGANVPNLLQDQLSLLLRSILRVNLNVMDRTFVTEKNGIRKSVEGWSANQVVFTKSKKVGSLVWSTTAEEFSPTEGVNYAKPNDYMLLSMSGTTDPVSRKTAIQAIAVPVLQDVHSMYYLDTEDADDDIQTEGDANFSYKGADYTRASVISGLNEASKKAKATDGDTDAILQNKINALSDAQIEIFEAELIAA